MSLLHAIETCLRLSNTPPSRFGRESVRDPRLVHDLRNGRQPGRRMEARVRSHIALVLAEVLAAGGAAGAAGAAMPGGAAGAGPALRGGPGEQARRNAIAALARSAGTGSAGWRRG